MSGAEALNILGWIFAIMVISGLVLGTLFAAIGNEIASNAFGTLNVAGGVLLIISQILDVNIEQATLSSQRIELVIKELTELLEVLQ